MESSFGHRFERVRIHADRTAADSARELDARAYTFGEHVVFGAGQLSEDTSAGRQLVAHELTHVLQQRAHGVTVQRAPDQPRSTAGDLSLPWKHGDHSLFEMSSAGVRFLVAWSSEQESTVREAIPAIAKRIAADNARISDTTRRVRTCIIANSTTRFALWNGAPVLVLDPWSVDVAVAAHEMGHALFHALGLESASKGGRAARAGNFRLSISDIYARLSETKDHTVEQETHPAGLWIADPSQWVPGGKLEHPWQDPDEFFASSKAAYQVNRKGFERAIERLAKVDAKVRGPAKELLALLGAFLTRGTLPAKGPPKDRLAVAATELGRETGVSKVEDTIISGTPLDWLLNPASRPARRKARPTMQSP